MPLPAPIAESFHRQADGSVGLGSPFTALVCRLLADRLEPVGLFAGRIGGWSGNPRDDALAVRAAGAFHALARSGRFPPLSLAYPPHLAEPDTLWAAMSGAIVKEDAFLNAYLDGPPQTNEVARSNAILGGCLTIAEMTGRPLALYEIGSSAGLNLGFDRYRYDLGVGSWGADGAPVRIASRWEGDPPSLTTPLVVARRAGCDVRPLDASSPQDREKLLSYVWPDQFDRVARMEAALSAAQHFDWRIERADAAEWLEAKFNSRPVDGTTRVLFHTIVWQYLPRQTKERVKTLIRTVGAAASVDAPIAWLSMEPDDVDGSAAIRLTVWPSGTTHRLGRADYHGWWTRWHKESVDGLS